MPTWQARASRTTCARRAHQAREAGSRQVSFERHEAALEGLPATTGPTRGDGELEVQIREAAYYRYLARGAEVGHERKTGSTPRPSCWNLGGKGHQPLTLQVAMAVAVESMAAGPSHRIQALPLGLRLSDGLGSWPEVPLAGRSAQTQSPVPCRVGHFRVVVAGPCRVVENPVDAAVFPRSRMRTGCGAVDSARPADRDGTRSAVSRTVNASCVRCRTRAARMPMCCSACTAGRWTARTTSSARLLMFIATLREHGASRVTALLPYLAYARKDQRTKPFDPVGLRYVAQMFEAVGTDHVIVLEVHNVAAFQNAFRCTTVHLDAHGAFDTISGRAGRRPAGSRLARPRRREACAAVARGAPGAPGRARGICHGRQAAQCGARHQQPIWSLATWPGPRSC